MCYSKEICSLSAISLENDLNRQNTFEVFEDVKQMTTEASRNYFKKFIECTNLEQASEKNRQIISQAGQYYKETNLKMTKLRKEENGTIVIILEKPASTNKLYSLDEKS